MAIQNGYNNYAKERILNASPAQLTLMLYDGAIKFCNIAIAAVEKGDVMKAHNNIMKVEKIIGEFRATLDFKYPVAEDFDKVYQYIMDRLIEANIKKDKDILEEVLTHLRTMRETWDEVMKHGKQQTRA